VAGDRRPAVAGVGRAQQLDAEMAERLCDVSNVEEALARADQQAIAHDPPPSAQPPVSA
jgi:hypothetical protein